MKRFLQLSRPIISTVDMSRVVILTSALMLGLQSCALRTDIPMQEMSVLEVTLAVQDIINGNSIGQVMEALAGADDGGIECNGMLSSGAFRSIGYFFAEEDRVTWNVMPAPDFKVNPTETSYFVVRIRAASKILYEHLESKVKLGERDASGHQTFGDSLASTFVLNLMSAVENEGFEATVVGIGLAYIQEKKSTFWRSQERIKSEKSWFVAIPDDSENSQDYWLSDTKE